VVLKNLGQKDFLISKGDPVALLTLEKVADCEVVEAKLLEPDTEGVFAKSFSNVYFGK
jgi:dUTPase